MVNRSRRSLTRVARDSAPFVPAASSCAWDGLIGRNASHAWGPAHLHVVPWLTSLLPAGPEQKFNAAQTAYTQMAWGLTNAPKADASPFGRTRIVRDTFWNKNSNQCAQ